MGQTRYLLKSLVFKSRFFFKDRKQGQQQLYLQHKVCSILNNLVGAASFSQAYCAYNHPYNLD